MSEYAFNSWSSLGNCLPALQVGIILFSPPGKGTKQEIRCLSSALLPQRRLCTQEGGARRRAVPQALLLAARLPERLLLCGPVGGEKGRQLE